LRLIERVVARARGRPRADQADELRHAVIGAAARGFMSHGFEGASIEAIARDANVTKVTIYRQFGTKEQLFIEVARHAQDFVRAELLTGVDMKGAPATVLRNIIGRLLDVATRPEYVAILRLVIAEAPRFPQVAEAMLARGVYAVEPLVQYLERLREERRIDVENPRNAAIQLAALATGSVRYLLHSPSQDPAAREHWIESVYATFARAWGLERPPPRR
jgi:AcrR family transcriptional regulator